MATWCLWLLAAACGADPSSEAGVEIELAPARSGRFGTLRDLVLFERTGLPAGRALFVDRFETTEGDWREFASSAKGRSTGAGEVSLTGNSALPVNGVDLMLARSFAHWRCGRLPSVVEWELVTVGDGRSMFPWGSKQDPSRANTGELALGSVTAVGTFESGRRLTGDAPYDLIGNVGEWTESVPWRWCDSRLELLVSFDRALRRVRTTPALSLWAGPGGILPLGTIAAAGGAEVPHTIVGSDFQTPMAELYGEQLAGERRQRTGLRVYTTAGELLLRLTEEPAPSDARERSQLQRFVWRGRHREVLQAAAAGMAEPRPGTAASALLLILNGAGEPR